MQKYQSAHSLEKEEVKEGKSTTVKYSFEERAEHIKQNIGDGKRLGLQKTDEGRLYGISYDLLKDLPEIVQRVEELREGNSQKACADITLGEYVQQRYAIPCGPEGQADTFFKMIGVNKNQVTFASLVTGGLSFTTIPELNKNYEWLIGETVVEALRAGMMARGWFRRLVRAMETVPFDSIKIPIIKNPNAPYSELREGETVKVGAVEFDEIAVETKDIGTAFRLSERVMRNVRINILQQSLAAQNGFELDSQLLYEGIQRLINGNQPSFADAAPVVGVSTPGAFDYDNDWLELVIGMAQLGYSPTLVIGSRSMIKEAMSLPEFKGFDGMQTLANTDVLVPMPSDYMFMPTGAMPDKGGGGGKLLFIDPNRAMVHYTTKPLTIERARLIRNLTDEYVVSFTSAFVKEKADASMILDSSVNIAVNPFPASYDMQSFERALGGFKRGF